MIILPALVYYIVGFAYQVTADNVQVLNAVKSKLPFLVTTSDNANDSVKEEIRLRCLV